MRLVSIISTWADTLNLLPKCIENHLQFSDAVIVCWSARSNYGVHDERMLKFVVTSPYERVLFHQVEPVLGSKATPLFNETRKRNQGIELAKQHGFTHYIIADADEMYVPSEAIAAKKHFDDRSLNGLVCHIRVYVGKPTLWCIDQNTIVPFIHKLNKDTYVGRFMEYPQAFKKGIAQIDPSRRPNVITGVSFCETDMHHYSYVRDNMRLKIENSTARSLRKKGRDIQRELDNAAPGWKSILYHQELQESENIFSI